MNILICMDTIKFLKKTFIGYIQSSYHFNNQKSKFQIYFQGNLKPSNKHKRNQSKMEELQKGGKKTTTYMSFCQVFSKEIKKA